MDPEATLRNLLASGREGDYAEVIQSAASLLAWFLALPGSSLSVTPSMRDRVAEYLAEAADALEDVS